MTRGRLRRVALALLVASAATAALLAGSTATARADYGPGTQFQVEISANNVQGGNFWFWAALGPGQESDYQNTDCIHSSAGGNPHSGPNGAAHTSGELSSWSDSGGTIEMDGVQIVGGLETANFYISDAPHSNTFTIVATGGVPVLPIGVPLIWSGRGVQVQVAP
jgi:hypothetical protein